MESLNLICEWSLAEITGIQKPFLSGLAPDPKNGCVWATERTTGQLIKLNVTDGQVQHHTIQGMTYSGDLCIDGIGKLYACSQGANCFYILNNIGHIARVVDLKNGVPLRISGVPTGGVVICMLVDRKVEVAYYTMMGEEVWRWHYQPKAMFPDDYNAVVPVCYDELVLVATSSDTIKVHQLNYAGDILDTAVVVSTKNKPYQVKSRKPHLLKIWPLYLFDATKTTVPSTTLLLYDVQTQAGGKSLLASYQLNSVPVAFSVPARVRGISMFGEEYLVGYWNDLTHDECKVLVFSAPDWSLGTGLDDL